MLKTTKYKKGFSLVETLVVLTIFATITILITQSLAEVLKSSRKSEAQVAVRSSLSNAMSVMERRIFNSQRVSSCTTSSSSSTVEFYIETDENSVNYTCFREDTVTGTPGFIRYITSSGSEELTSTNTVNITDCTFTCNANSVEFDVVAESTKATGPEGVELRMSTRVLLRTLIN